MSPEIKRGPIGPEAVGEFQSQQIPEEVFVAFNALIAQNLHAGRAKVLQENILKMLAEQGMDRREIFNRHWLDVEESYRAKGWSVCYDRPVAWAGENYEPFFEFRAPKGKPKTVQEYY